MPKMDGNCVARHLRQQVCYDDTLIIAVTGYHDEARQFQGGLADPMPVGWENGELKVTGQ